MVTTPTPNGKSPQGRPDLSIAAQQIVKIFEGLPLETRSLFVPKCKEFFIDEPALPQAVVEKCPDLAESIAELLGSEFRWPLKKRPASMPPITSTQKTMMPSCNGMRGLTQSYGPGVQASLWNQTWAEEGPLKEMPLITPNNSLLRVLGKNESEQKALQYYIVEEMGVEGLKHLVVLLNAYYIQTDAKERKDDAYVSLRQLLLQMGYGNLADDKAEQRKLMHSILYLSRTWIRSTEAEYEQDAKRRGRKRWRSVEYSPLLVLETMKPGPDGSLQLPEAVEFHLGKEFYDLMFGERKHYFVLPTAQILYYHAVREQQEICLAFYLSNFINLNGGHYEVGFPEMVAGSGLRLEEDIKRGHDRTRDALRVLYALEHLQRDSWLIRMAHPDADVALAVELITGMCSPPNPPKATKLPTLSVEMYERIQGRYAYLRAYSPTELRKYRREALQRLLNGHSETLHFKAGSLIKEQAEKREEQRKQAIECNELAQIARVVKAATKQVAKNIREEQE